MNKNDTDIVGWMTVKGVHIPIRKGQSREKAMTEFLKGANSQNPFQDRTKLPEKISLPDETLPHSIGAKWANYDISMPDGTKAKFQEGSKLTHKEVFAGSGTKKAIRDVDRLIKEYPVLKLSRGKKSRLTPI